LNIYHSSKGLDKVKEVAEEDEDEKDEINEKERGHGGKKINNDVRK
jgi:hypothetical protein